MLKKITNLNKKEEVINKSIKIGISGTYTVT